MNPRHVCWSIGDADRGADEGADKGAEGEAEGPIGGPRGLEADMKYMGGRWAECLKLLCDNLYSFTQCCLNLHKYLTIFILFWTNLQHFTFQTPLIRFQLTRRLILYRHHFFHDMVSDRSSWAETWIHRRHFSGPVCCGKN